MASESVPQLALTNHQAAVFSVTAQLDEVYYTNGFLSAIVLKESSLCQNLHDQKKDHNAWGCGQLHVKTVKDSAGVDVTPEQLMSNPRLNLELTGYIIRNCMDRFEDNIYRAIMCYTVGYRRAYFLKSPETMRYAKQVMLLREELIQYSQQRVRGPVKHKGSSTSLEQPIPNSVLACMTGIDGTSTGFLCPYYSSGQIDWLDEQYLNSVPKVKKKLDSAKPLHSRLKKSGLLPPGK